MKIINTTLLVLHIVLLGCANEAIVKTKAQGVEWDVSPETKELLLCIENARNKYTTLESKEMKYTTHSSITDDTEVRTGRIVFQKELKDKEGKTTPAKFRLTFDTLQLGKGRKLEKKTEYIFDGQCLTIANWRMRLIRKIQTNPLRIGQGPFPIPFGLKANEFLPIMKASTRSKIESDPDSTRYLKLVPRDKHKKDINFICMEIWIDRNTYLPIRVVRKDKNKYITTVEYSNIIASNKIESELYHMKKPIGWKMNVGRRKPKPPPKRVPQKPQ